MVCLFKRRQRVVVENEVDQNKNRKNLCILNYVNALSATFFFFFLHFSDKVYSVHLGVAKSLHLYFFENYTVKVKMYFFFYIWYICLSGNKQITF